MNMTPFKIVWDARRNGYVNQGLCSILFDGMLCHLQRLLDQMQEIETGMYDVKTVTLDFPWVRFFYMPSEGYPNFEEDCIEDHDIPERHLVVPSDAQLDSQLYISTSRCVAEVTEFDVQFCADSTLPPIERYESVVLSRKWLEDFIESEVGPRLNTCPTYSIHFQMNGRRVYAGKIRTPNYGDEAKSLQDADEQLYKQLGPDKTSMLLSVTRVEMGHYIVVHNEYTDGLAENPRPEVRAFDVKLVKMEDVPV